MLADLLPPISSTKAKPWEEPMRVVPEPLRCMQCGICSYNCPAGIDVRAYAWDGKPVDDSRCLTCGLCVATCPRYALHFEPIHVVIWSNA